MTASSPLILFRIGLKLREVITGTRSHSSLVTEPGQQHPYPSPYSFQPPHSSVSSLRLFGDHLHNFCHTHTPSVPLIVQDFFKKWTNILNKSNLLKEKLQITSLFWFYILLTHIANVKLNHFVPLLQYAFYLFGNRTSEVTMRGSSEFKFLLCYLLGAMIWASHFTFVGLSFL